MATQPNHFTVKDLASLFGVTDRTIHRWIEEGQLPKPMRIGPRPLLRWERTVIEKFIKQQRKAAEAK